MAQPVPQPKFKVLKALGKGSYGTVYKVQRMEDGGIYAMKETDLTRMGPKERADAVNEIRVLGSMSHPNVVRHHETFVSGNKLCIVMEFAPAGDLASFLKAAAASKLPLPEATVWQIFLQLCQGMQAIHETCVIHRDIKPANIFMCPDNVVKIGDLGVAKALTKASHAQTVIGTPLYMAPEVWRGLRYSYSSDLWSLGGVLYEMMTHRLPFDARSLNELKNKIIMGSFSPLAPNAPYSAGLVAVCHALLSKDPRKRPTCSAILNSREAAPWMHTIPEVVRCPLPALDAQPGVGPAALGAVVGGANPQLLPTIQVPRDIRLLPHRLPKPSYGSSDAKEPAAAAMPAAPARSPSPSAMMGQMVAGRHVMPAAGAAVGRSPLGGGVAPAAGAAGGMGGARVPSASPRGPGAGVPLAAQPSPRGVPPAGGPLGHYHQGAAGRPGFGGNDYRAAPQQMGAGYGANKVAAAGVPPAGGVRAPSAGRVAAAGAAAGAQIGAIRGGIGAAGGAQYPQRAAGRPPMAAPPARGGWPY